MMGADLATSVIDATASTLVHLVWQGGAIALVLAAVLRTLRGARAETRYLTSVAALVAIALAAGLTFAWQWDAPAAASNISLMESAVALPAPLDRAPAILGASAALPDRSSWREIAEAWAPALVALWFAGVFVFSLRLAIGYARVLELVREAEQRVSEPWTSALRAISRRLPLASTVRLLQSRRVEVPTVIGWLRPVILIPASALTGLDARQIETILAHELAHIRRHDYLVNLFQSAIETLLFYHPAVWWISRQVRIERENCCDDLAIAMCGDRLLYAQALAELEELRALAQPSLAATGGSLLARIRRIVGGDSATHVHSGWFAAFALLTLAAAVAVAAPMTSHREDGSLGPAADVLFWPADSGVAHVAAAIAGSSRFVLSAGVAESPESLRLEELDAGSVADVVETAHASSGYAYAFQVADVDAQGETITVREAREEDDENEDEGRTTSGLTIDDLVRLKNAGVDGAWVRRMRELGYDLSLGELAALRAIGVTPEYVDSLRAAGYTDLDHEELQALRAVGVSAEYIAELAKLGVERLPAEELVTMRAVGVTPAYIAQMRKLFGDDIEAEELAQLRAVGVTAEYVAAMKAAGAEVDVERMVELRAVGVTPEYVAALRTAGFAESDLDDVAAARAVGVTTEYLAEMAHYGIEDLDLEDVTGLRAVGVTPAWIHEMGAAGFPELEPDEMQQLRALGVSSAWVEELRAAGLRNLTAEDLIELRAAGIDAEFIRKLEGKPAPQK